MADVQRLYLFDEETVIFQAAQIQLY